LPLNQATGVTLGPDGNVWMAMNGNMAIGRVTPAGSATTFPVTIPAPWQLTTGSDGNIWFTESLRQSSAGLGRITPSGILTEFPFPRSDAEPEGITSGPDGNLWIAEFSANAIGRLSP
jgi:virginiamycin B lyase